MNSFRRKKINLLNIEIAWLDGSQEENLVDDWQSAFSRNVAYV